MKIFNNLNKSKNTIKKSIKEKTFEYSQCDLNQLFNELKTNKEGLDPIEVEEKREKYNNAAKKLQSMISNKVDVIKIYL